MRFTDRAAAGRHLAERLTRFRNEDPVVAGLPRGGVPVAFAVARALHAPLDVIVVRKLGLPWQPEVAFGALGEGAVRVVDEDLVRRTRLTPEQVEAVTEAEREVLRRRVARLRAGRARIPLAGRTVLVVDDGVATGATARAACLVAKAQGAARVIFAAPVAAPSAVADLAGSADEVVCPVTPKGFRAVGQWYRDFRPTSDDDVEELLRRSCQGDANRLPRGTAATAKSSTATKSRRTTMTDTIHRRTPPQGLVNAVNPLVRAMAASPLHRLLDTSVLVLHLTGRRTGRHYDVPVGFADLGDALLVVTQHRWRANLRDVTKVLVTHEGRTRVMRAQLTEDPAEVAGQLGKAIARLGRKDAQRRFGLSLPVDHEPDADELESAVREFSLATITLCESD